MRILFCKCSVHSQIKKDEKVEKAFEGPQGWEGPGGLDGLEG